MIKQKTIYKKIKQEEIKQDEIKQEKIIRLRIIITVLFTACIIYIWCNSIQNAAASAARSGQLTNLINEIISELSKGGGIVITELFVRKFAHFAEYALLGVLTVLLFLAYYLKPVKRLPVIFLIGLLTAAVDESIQLYAEGRSAALLDVCIDMFGFLCSVSVSCIFYLLYIQKIVSEKQKKI